VSDAAEAVAEAAADWERLERAAHAAASAVAELRRRATEAEAEVQRLRRELELVGAAHAGDAGDELRRLRAENALLSSRTGEARKRIRSLMAKLAILEARR
jgi:chromosome segregation ATPase